MRDAMIRELAVREIATYCEFADFAHRHIDGDGAQDAAQTFFFIHSFLAHCATVAHLVWSPELAPHAGGQSIGAVLGVPPGYRIAEENFRETVDRYDRRLVRGLETRGEIAKILNSNIGDRDAFEEELAIFLRHYDPTVEALTLMEEELDLRRIWVEVEDIGDRARQWLAEHAQLVDRPASASIPPRRV